MWNQPTNVHPGSLSQIVRSLARTALQFQRVNLSRLYEAEPDSIITNGLPRIQAPSQDTFQVWKCGDPDLDQCPGGNFPLLLVVHVGIKQGHPLADGLALIQLRFRHGNEPESDD